MSHDANQSDSPTISSTSLILRIQAKDNVAWERFVRLYTPFVYGMCRAGGIQESDAHDVCQDVMGSVVAGINSYQRTGSFRGWISQITRNRMIDYHRRNLRHPPGGGGTDLQIQLQEIPEDLTQSSCSNINGEPLMMHALNMIREEFESSTWTAFWRMVVENHSAAEVAKDLGWFDIDDSASRAKGTKRVRQAKFRVMKRLKDEFGEMLDISDSVN